MNKNPFISIYWESTRPLRFLTIPVGFLASIGIGMRANNPSEDLALVIGLSPWYVWAAILAFSSIFRLYGLVFPEEKCTRDDTCLCIRNFGSMIIGLLNIVVWSVLFVSSSLAKDFGLGILLVVPCVIEVWLLSRAIATYSTYYKFWKRKRHDE